MISNRVARGQQYDDNGTNKILIKKNSARNTFVRFPSPPQYISDICPIPPPHNISQILSKIINIIWHRKD